MRSTWKVSSEDVKRLNNECRFMLRIFGMEVGRKMIVIIHGNHDAKELADPWHMPSRYSLMHTIAGSVHFSSAARMVAQAREGVIPRFLKAGGARWLSFGPARSRCSSPTSRAGSRCFLLHISTAYSSHHFCRCWWHIARYAGIQNAARKSFHHVFQVSDNIRGAQQPHGR